MHCSAKLQPEEQSIRVILTNYDKELKYYLKLNFSKSCHDTNTTGHPLCSAFIFGLKFSIYKISILHSNGVGIFSLDSSGLDIFKSLLAYNRIDCVSVVLSDTKSTSLNISQSQIKFGQEKSPSLKFASGLNIFVCVTGGTHKITVKKYYI